MESHTVYQSKAILSVHAYGYESEDEENEGGRNKKEKPESRKKVVAMVEADHEKRESQRREELVETSHQVPLEIPHTIPQRLPAQNSLNQSDVDDLNEGSTLVDIDSKFEEPESDLGALSWELTRELMRFEGIHRKLKKRKGKLVGETNHLQAWRLLRKATRHIQDLADEEQMEIGRSV